MREPELCDSDEMIAMMRAGDLDALERMTRCYGDRLMAVGRRYCRTEDEAKDAVQDALLSAGEHLTDFRGEGSPQSWLARMVANACHRMRRGRKNDPALHEDLADQPLVDATRNPEEAAHHGEIAVALGEVLLDLKPTDRLILLLSQAEEWRAPEIGDALDMTANAVRVRLSRIRARLRPQLEAMGL